MCNYLTTYIDYKCAYIYNIKSQDIYMYLDHKI